MVGREGRPGGEEERNRREDRKGKVREQREVKKEGKWEESST